MNIRQRIIIVDDEPDLLETLADELEEEGFDVVKASNGQVALEHLQKEVSGLDSFDAILSDINMPVMNGLGSHARWRPRYARKTIQTRHVDFNRHQSCQNRRGD